MPNYLEHLITDPNAPATREWCARVEAYKRTVPANVRAAYRAELAAAYTRATPDPKAPRQPAQPRSTGTVNDVLAVWWREHRTNFDAVTAAVRFAAKQYPDVSRTDFVATLVSLGVNSSTAAIQFKKGREG